MRPMQHNVLLLALCQAMLITATSLMISSAPLVGQHLAGPALATVPMGLMFLGNMCMTFPASLLMKRHGRQAGFALGGIMGLSGAMLSTLGVVSGSFLLFCGGAFLIGLFNSTGQFYRFAAADTATPDYRSRAISWVLAGGVLAALLGPNLAAYTRNSFEPEFAGSYASLIGIYLLALSFIATLRIPKPSLEESQGGGRRLTELARQPAFMVAVAGAMIAYGVMNLVMTATPLAMHAHAHTFGSTALVIQWHVLGMFVPSFFTGHLIRYFGVLNVMLTGGVLLLVCVAVNLSGTEVMHFTAALILLGLGWNFLYIGASVLLTETYRPAEKAKTQALHDFIVFTTVTMTAFSAGAIHNTLGWQVVNMGVLPFIALSLLATGWLRQRGIRTRTT